MDASFQQPLLSFRTLLFSFIDIIFVHKTQSCYPPLQGNFISRPRLIRNSSILDLPDTLVATTAFSTFCTSLSAIDITIFAEKKQSIVILFIVLFFQHSWHLAYVQQKYSYLFYNWAPIYTQTTGWISVASFKSRRWDSKELEVRKNPIAFVRLSFARLAVAIATSFAGYWCATIALGVLYETWRSFL